MAIQHVPLTDDQEERLVRWLHDSLETISEKRIQRVESWRRYREQYEGSVQGEKNFPWPGASNVFVPITAIIVDAVHANMMNRIFGFERIWDVNAVHPSTVVGQNVQTAQPINWTDLASKVQDYLNLEGSQQGKLDLYEPLEGALLETVKLGTSVLYNPWVTLTHEEHVLDPNSGEILRNEPVTVFDGVKPQMLALEDFLILPHYPEIHGPFGSPLVGHHYWLRAGELEGMRDLYRRGALDKVLGAPGSIEDEDLKNQQTEIEGEPDTYDDLRRDDYRLQDLWIKFPLTGKHEFRLFVTYHWQTNTIMRIQPWIYRTPPYVPFRYVRREGRFYGIGIPEMVESIQHGTNTSFNQAVDNATIANMRCFKVKSGTKAARMFGDIYPGKKFIVDSKDDIEDFQLGEVYPSIFQVGLLLRDMAERRTAITDFNLGRESEVLGRSSTATTTMALLQEGARRFDLYAKDIRRGIAELGMQTLELFQQQRPVRDIHETMQEDGELVERALILPHEFSLRRHLIVTATAASSSSNKEAARQNSMAAFGMLTQYMERLFQLATVMVNPQLPEPMRKLAYDMSQTGEKLMQRVLEGFDLPDISTMLPQLEGLLNAAQGVNQNPNAVPGMGGPNGDAMGAQGAAPAANAGAGFGSGLLGPGG